jgi:hypothetical protein
MKLIHSREVIAKDFTLTEQTYDWAVSLNGTTVGIIYEEGTGVFEFRSMIVRNTRLTGRTKEELLELLAGSPTLIEVGSAKSVAELSVINCETESVRILRSNIRKAARRA